MKFYRQMCRISLLLLLWAMPLSAARADAGNTGAWGDQGNGTYKNPILPGDYSDPDVIRVGRDYYLITSTFQYSPGIAVLHSKDLVNWKYIGHCVADLTQIGPELNWDRMNRYNRGIYAGAIRYHDGKFWVFFTTMDEGVFMTTAINPAGPWEPLHRVWDGKGWDDPCPFWDDDGKAYLLLSQPGEKWWTHLFQMAPDGSSIDLASDFVVDSHHGSEGNKLYKIKGMYYVFHNEIQEERVGVMMRANSLHGPWEEKRVLQNAPGKHEREPNQGGLVQTEKGDWWFITQQGRGDYDGRPSHLLPVRWIDGWPVPGDVDPKSGAGAITWTYPKPILGLPIGTPQSNDEFDSPPLAPQWEWNYQPRLGKWSLTERRGWLRLHAFRPIQTGNLMKAGDTLTQRLQSTEGGEAVVKMDVSGMADGQTCGLCFFWSEFCTLGAVQAAGVRRIEFNNNGVVTVGPTLTERALWCKAIISSDGSSVFAYSLNGKAFTRIGGVFPFGWANYRGTRLGLYCYNNDSDSGFVDVDWFHYHYVGPTASRK